MKYFDNLIDILSDSLRSIDENVFLKLVSDCNKVLDEGHKIIVSGLGKNVPICDKFVGTMVSLGLDAYFLHTNSAVHGDMGIVKEGDLVIMLTKSGETSESIYLARKLKTRNIKMWLLTFNEKSTLTSEIKNCLIIHLKHEGDEWNIVPNNSTTINLIVLQALAMEIAKERKISLREFRNNHPGGNIGQLLCEDIQL